jgi:hypothetical protein
MDIPESPKAIFTFTDTEAAAVRSLLNSYIDTNRTDATPWRAAVLGR